MDDLERVLEAWRVSPQLHQFEPAATDDDLRQAESDLRRPLPNDLRRLYGVGNGMTLMDGNLQIDPLSGRDSSLVANGDRLREYGWPVPHDLMIFGSNGGEELFGLWYPPHAERDWIIPVVMMGEIFEPASFALAGTDLAPFLRAWSGYYLQLYDAPVRALDVLQVPSELRASEEQRGMTPFFEWSDPSLPDPDPDPHEHGLDETDLANLIESKDLLRPRGRGQGD